MALHPSPPSILVSSVFFNDSLPSFPLSDHLAACSPDAAAAEVDVVSADADQELVSMMATLGLPSTFGTSSEVKSTKKGRKAKVAASRVVVTHCDSQVVDAEHDVSERGTDTLATSSEVKSTKKGRKAKTAASRVVVSHCDSQVVDAEHDVSERGTETSATSLEVKSTKKGRKAKAAASRVVVTHCDSQVVDAEHDVSERGTDTFDTSLEVKSTKKGRKAKTAASRVVVTHCDSQVVDAEHDVLERGIDTTSLTHVEFPAQYCNISNDESLHLSGIKDSCIVDNVQDGTSYNLSWEPVWDVDCQRFYYCNFHTLESTWDVPEGVVDLNAYIGSRDNFIDEIVAGANLLQEEGPIEEAHAYESSLFVSRRTSNSLRESTVSEEVGSVGLIVNDTNDSGVCVSVAPLGGNLDQESEENSEMTKRKSRAAGASATGVPVLSKSPSYPESESVDGLGGKVSEVDQTTVIRTLVLEEKIVDSLQESFQMIMSMKRKMVLLQKMLDSLKESFPKIMSIERTMVLQEKIMDSIQESIQNVMSMNRAMVLQEKILNSVQESIQNVMSMISMQTDQSVHFKTRTKISLSQGTHIRFPGNDGDGDDDKDKGKAIFSSCETTVSKDNLNGSQGDVSLVNDLPLVFGLEKEKDSEDIEGENEIITILDKRKKKRKSIPISEKMPTEAWSGLAENLDPVLVEEMCKRTTKYWYQRYRLFTRYDEGIMMDEEGWFSVTPESIAQHQAARMCSGGLIIDAFTGVGGNAIQFALRGNHVIAVDIDPVKIDCARHNAAIYGVADYIEFIVGDFFKIAPKLKADAVFLSPPWGGPGYTSVNKFDLHTMIQPLDGFKLFQIAQVISPNVVLFLPRNVDFDQLVELSRLASPTLPCEAEKNFVNRKLKTITAYYGEFARTKTPD